MIFFYGEIRKIMTELSPTPPEHLLLTLLFRALTVVSCLLRGFPPIHAVRLHSTVSSASDYRSNGGKFNFQLHLIVKPQWLKHFYTPV